MDYLAIANSWQVWLCALACVSIIVIQSGAFTKLCFKNAPGVGLSKEECKNCIPMDLDDMNPSRVGAAFGLITACGLIFGFIAPTVGGILTEYLSSVSGLGDPIASHVFGLRWSLFLFGFVNIIGTVCMLRIRETGLAKKHTA